MAEKKLLLLETNFDVAKKYEDFLKESVWKIEHRDSLNSFLASMKENEFDVAVVEGGIVPDKIISMVLVSKPVIVCSDNKPDIEKITTIPRHFSGSELVNALGKVSFMKVTGKNEPEKEAVYSIEETIGGEKPVLLEPVFDEEEEAELLTPEEDNEPVRSSWEIPNEKEDVDLEAETLMDEGSDSVEKPGIDKKEVGGKKEDIFEKIDEIDSIIMSINKDVNDKKDNAAEPEPAEPEPFEESKSQLSNPFGKDDESADFLFDDDYKYEDRNEKVEIGEVSDDEDINASRVSAFESILLDEDPVKKDNQIELNKINDAEAEMIKDFKGQQGTPEKFAEPEEVVEPEPAAEPELENVEEGPAEEPEEKAKENSVIEEEILKNEFRKWLDENARSIIKEVVEEQLRELYGKK